jgi:macrolide-specific efflux system membrane fusion protein
VTTTEAVTTDSDEESPGFPAPAQGRTRRRRGKWWLLFGVALVAAAGFALWWFVLRAESETQPATFETVQQLTEVSTGTYRSTVSAEGSVAATETEDLSFSSAGTVAAVRVEVGDVVEAGDVLARIDSAELEATVAEAQAQQDELEAQLADDIDNDASDEQIALDEARLAVAADQLESAEDALAGRRLVAGMDGTVTEVNLTVGEELASGGISGVTMTGSGSGSGNSAGALGSDTGQPSTGSEASTDSAAHVSLVSVGSYKVDLAIDTTDIGDIEVGQTVTISEATASPSNFGGAFPGGGFPGGFPGGGGELPGVGGGLQDDGIQPAEGGSVVTGGATATGEVTAIAAIADATSGVASYTVTVEFADDTDEFYVGTTVIAEIVTGERIDVIQVPAQAVTSGPDGSTVTVAVDGTLEGELEIRAVTTGESSGAMIEVTGGVAVGEIVVVDIQLPAGFTEEGPGGFPGGDIGGFPGGEGGPEGERLPVPGGGEG